MKKKVASLSLAAALALGTLSGVAGAADPLTAEEKYKALMEAGIFEGFPDGEAHLDRKMTRAEASKIAVLILGLQPDPDAASDYKDIQDAEWAAGFVGAATKAGIVEGKGNGVFDPNASVTIEQLAKIMVKSLGINTGYGDAEVEGASDWAKNYIEAAINAGLIPASDDYTSSADRKTLVDTAYDANELNKEVETVREENKKSIGILLALDVMDVEDGKFNGAENISKEDLAQIVKTISNGKVDAADLELPDSPTFSDILRLLLQSLGYPESALTDDSKLVEKAIEAGIVDKDSVLVKTQLSDAPVRREWAAFLTAGTVFNAGTVEVKEDGTVTINKDKHLSQTIPVPDKPKQVDVTDIANLPRYDELKDIDPALVNRDTATVPTTPVPNTGGSGDVIAPKITAATIDGKAVTVDQLTGASGEITLTSDHTFLTEGTITVNEAATLTITAIEGLALDEFEDDFFTEQLQYGENEFQLIDKLGEAFDLQNDGVSVAYLQLLERAFDEDDFYTIKGSLKDSAGNTREVTLNIKFPQVN